MNRESTVQIIFALVCVALLAGAGVVSTQLTSSASRNKLVFTDHSIQSLPPQVGLGIAMGPFRGVFINFLWIRAQELKMEGKHHEAMNLARAITLLQPRFSRVWTFHAWNMAYNISVTAQDPRERWEWVKKGIELLRDEGLVYNPNDLLIHREMGWIYLHKIGGLTDDSNMYYKQALAAEWTEYLGEPPTIPITLREQDAVALARGLRGEGGYRLRFEHRHGVDLARQFPAPQRAEFDALVQAETEFGRAPGQFLSEQQSLTLATMLERAVEAGNLPRIIMRQRTAGALYELWFARIAEAPDTMNELASREPEVRELERLIRRDVEPDLDAAFLRRYQQMRALLDSPFRNMQAEMGPRSTALRELMEDAQMARAWDALIPFVRKRVLVEELRMEPPRMLRMIRKYGPVDFRHPGAHALYWSMRGVEQALSRVEERNKEDFDFLNADRQVLHSLQLLYRYGDIWFDYLYFVIPDLSYSFKGDDGEVTRSALYLQNVNVHMIDTYEQLLNELRIRAVERGDRPEDPTKTPYTTYSAGYENFLRDVIRRLYRSGDKARAEYYHYKLITFDDRNVHVVTMSQEIGKPLEDFVQDQYVDERILTDYVAQSDLFAILQAAYIRGLLGSDQREFSQRIAIARQIHEFYVNRQVRDVTATGSRARTEVFDRNFEVVAGDIFRRTITALGIEDAETMYDRAPIELKRWAYDALLQLFDAVQNRDVALAGRPFSEVFPEPRGMQQFRENLEAYQRGVLQERQGQVGSPQGGL